MENSQPTRAPRLRSACNQCNASKVKCTGEHNGCARCRNLNTDCVYTESRVGKVQSSRSKRKRSHKRTVAPVTVLRTNRDGNSGNSAGTLPPYSPTWPSNASRTPQQQNDLSWSDPWGHNPGWALDVPMMASTLSGLDDIVDGNTVVAAASGMGSTGFGDATHGPDGRDIEVVNTYSHGMDSSTNLLATNMSPSGMTQSSITTTSGAMVLAGLGGSIGEGLGHAAHGPNATRHDNSDTDRSSSISRSSRSSSVQDRSVHDKGHTSLTSNSSSRRAEKIQRSATLKLDAEPTSEDLGRLDSHCVLSCVRVIGTLENYLLGGLKNLDLITETISRSGVEVRKLVQLQQKSRCDRCVLLFNTIIFQMIELLEAGAKPLSDGRADFPGASLFPIAEAGFGFGSLSPSTEEQRLWRSRIVRGACQRVGEVMSGVIGLARLGPRGVTLPPEAAAQRVKCLVDMELKLKNLYEREGGEGPVVANASQSSSV